MIYPNNNFSECAIRNINSWVIDAKGDVYKCWEIIGNKEYKVGELCPNGIEITNFILLNRYLYGADPLDNKGCINCLSFPICIGGCPHKRIENEFNNRGFDICTDFSKDYLEKYLIKRIEYENNQKSK